MNELFLLLRVLFAAGLSGAIGIERQFHGRPAGLRTHLLVGIGAALVMVTFSATSSLLPTTGTWMDLVRIDPGRLAAGIITGVGFLGAGTILRVGDWVRGLTTAASLWFVAALGIAAGDGLFILASGGAVIGLAVLTIVNRLENRIPSTLYHSLSIGVRPDCEEQVRQAIDARCRSMHMRAQLSSWEKKADGQAISMDFLIRHQGTIDIVGFASAVAAHDGVLNVEISS